MKKLLSVLFVMLIVVGITGCKKTEDDVLHLGLNAIIVEIDHEKQLLYVSAKNMRMFLADELP